MQGRRLPDRMLHEANTASPGDYWRQEVRFCVSEWWVRDPLGDFGRLTLHQVTEHPDGTITVSPSILNVGGHGYHGYLKAGVWEACDDSGRSGPRAAREVGPSRR